jgi:hypothetical protein
MPDPQRICSFSCDSCRLYHDLKGREFHRCDDHWGHGRIVVPGESECFAWVEYATSLPPSTPPPTGGPHDET